MDRCDICRQSKPLPDGDICEQCAKRREVLIYHFRIRHDAQQKRVDAIHNRYEVPRLHTEHSTIGPKWRLSG